MTPARNDLIAAVLEAAVEGAFRPFSEEPGYCLRLVRQCLERALGWSYEDVYGLVTHPVEEQPEGSIFARSMQRSLREAGCAVPWGERRRGLVVANHRLGYPIGHIALVVARDAGSTYVFENTASSRGVRIHGYNRLSRLEDWPHVSAVEVFDLERLGVAHDQAQV